MSLLWLSAFCACDAYDPQLMKTGDRGGGGGQDSLDASFEDAGDAAADADAGPEDAGPDADISFDCIENPDPSNESCREICPEVCNAQDDDCDGVVDEADVDRSCAAPHAQTQCLDGQCVVTQCLGGFRDCDQEPLTGCEIAPNDLDHCGGCGRVCRIADAVPACVDNLCVVDSCDDGFGDCDGDGLSCELRTNTLTDCGGCGVPCQNVPHASPSCATGACGVDQCDAGYGDCDGLGANGCEQPLDTLAHCGGCGVACSKASCSGGVCTAADCSLVPGSADCDKDEASCEVDLRSDPSNCGACGNRCQFGAGVTPHASLGCDPNGCTAVCDAGWGDCDGNYRNGCEQPLDTLTHCGGCGQACAIANATATCSSGSCRVQSCDADYADCDADQRSCEVRLNVPEHCGSCDNACNLANAVEGCGGRVGARACTVASCEGSWADCDAQPQNGCERDARPVASGGLGPCLPDANCTLGTNNGREYYVCATARSWTEARNRCQLQARGDLAQISSSAENNYVRSRINQHSWIGHNDSAREGLWVWANNRVPFWHGDTLSGQYANWAPGEPNGSGDCGVLYTSGQFDDTTCANSMPYVCEVGPDACPTDASKLDPGQCGCGTPDTDTDDDGYADCREDCDHDPSKIVPGVCGCGTPDVNTDGDSRLDCEDGCPTDPNKIVPGVCGCGTPDVNTDGDSRLDCEDGCPTDPDKIAPGTCGCGVADVDSDDDGVLDCQDGCPADPTITGACFPTYSNFDPRPIDFSTKPTVVLACSGTTTINTSSSGANMFDGNWCGTVPSPLIQPQSGGPELVVLPLKGLTVPAGLTIRVIGSRPVVFAVRGDATIAGILDANASGATPGAGGHWSCGTSAGANGAGSAGLFNGGSGGGGGGFGTAGGRGGRGQASSTQPAGGVTRGSATITPLYGGCPGGRGGGCSNTVGGGGGAIQITASGALTVSGTIRANGANGADGCDSRGGGAGGGSGGAVVLEATTKTIAGSVTANGGRGGAGPRLGGSNSGGNGSSSSSSAGSDGTNSSGDAGGGGGGGYGRIER